MKTTAKMIAMMFLLGAGIWLTPKEAQAHYGISYQVFYDDLSPYGTWVDSPEYGYVWVPNAGPEFMPYRTGGYWTYTIYGWTWVSSYSWGWAPFHYGRWYYDNWYGWVWVPGHEWGPGWVTWRQCDGYYGWAPLTPGINIYITVNWNIIPIYSWVFVPRGHFGMPGMDRYYAHRDHNEWLYQRSAFISGTEADRETNVRYYAGPTASEVSRATGRDVRPIEVTRSENHGQAVKGDRMDIYRPEVKERDVRSDTRTAPERYSNYQRNTGRTEPVVRNNEPQNTRQNVTPKPQTERVAPKPQTERVAPKPQTERVAPRPQTERVAPKPQQERYTPAPSQTNVKANRHPAPPAKQTISVRKETKPPVTQNRSQGNPAQDRNTGSRQPR